MKKKEFTLIELLAVIVILAIIALIAVPIVLNMIDSARKSGAKSSALGFIDAIEYNNGFAEAEQVGYTKINDGNYISLSDFENLKMKGKKPDSVDVTIENGSVKEAILCIDGYKVEYQNKDITKITKDCGNLDFKETVKTNTTSYIGKVNALNKADGTYDVSNLDIEEDKPSSGIIIIENETVKEAILIYGNYKAVYKNNALTVKTNDIETESVSVIKNYQINVSGATNYISSDTTTATVSNTGLVTALKEGNVIIYVLKNNELVKIYNISVVETPVTFDEGIISSNYTYGTLQAQAELLNLAYTTLTDGLKPTTKTGSYGGLHIDTYFGGYLKFTVKRTINITFSSASYVDSGGATGSNTIKFYKLNSSNEEVEYLSFVQQNGIDYETKTFEPGTYVARPDSSGGRYITFEEWEMSLVN